VLYHFMFELFNILVDCCGAKHERHFPGAMLQQTRELNCIACKIQGVICQREYELRVTEINFLGGEGWG